MNTNNENAAGVKPAFNEADVVAWLKGIAESTGIKGLTLQIDGKDYYNGHCVAQTEALLELGLTLSDAIDKVRAQIKSPAAIAAEKRAQAARLENEAALLELEALNAGTATLNLSSKQ